MCGIGAGGTPHHRLASSHGLAVTGALPPCCSASAVICLLPMVHTDFVKKRHDPLEFSFRIAHSFRVGSRPQLALPDHQLHEAGRASSKPGNLRRIGSRFIATVSWTGQCGDGDQNQRRRAKLGRRGSDGRWPCLDDGVKGVKRVKGDNFYLKHPNKGVKTVGVNVLPLKFSFTPSWVSNWGKLCLDPTKK